MYFDEQSGIYYGEKKVYTHLAIAAHQDDIEIMCGEAIEACYDDENKGFVAVVLSDGGGSPRNGEFADFTYEQMVAQRAKEQLSAAEKGRYAAVILPAYPSSVINSSADTVSAFVRDIIDRFKPKVLYTHNPADKHKTHVSVFKSVLSGAKSAEHKPESFFGCECWRALDWLCEEDKTVFKINNPELILSLLNEHRSQVLGGKRYDLALEGRWRANATFLRSHTVDVMNHASYALEMLPLLSYEGLSPEEFIDTKIENFKKSILL